MALRREKITQQGTHFALSEKGYIGVKRSVELYRYAHSKNANLPQ
jgi:hypothetical protein